MNEINKNGIVHPMELDVRVWINEVDWSYGKVEVSIDQKIEDILKKIDLNFQNAAIFSYKNVLSRF